MRLKQGLIVAVAALAVFALPASSAFASTAQAETTELHYCEGAIGQAGDCATWVATTAEWVQADYAINSCLESTSDWTAADVESCIVKWDPTATVTRSHVDAAGTTTYRRVKHRQHAKGKHHRAGNTARASRS